jgi:hypothetical protein
MEHENCDSPKQLTATISAQTRRREPRVDSQLKVTFSGMIAKLMVVENGVVTDLCQDGLGILADEPVTSGMDLALFIECPDSEDDLCIPDAHVEWVNGSRLGVSIRRMKPEDQERLQRILAQAHRQPICQEDPAG